MPPAWIIEPIDVLEYCSFCLPAGFPLLTPNQFNLQRFEERLNHGIVITIALAAHRNEKVMLLKTFLIVTRTVLRPAIGMVDAALWGSPQCHGHIQRTDCQIAFYTVADSPPKDTARLKIDDHRQVQPAFACPDVGDVSSPFLIGSSGREILIK